MSRSTIVISFNHFPEIAAALPDETSQVVRKVAFDVEAEAKMLVPVDTGNLKNSIRMVMEPDAIEAVVDIEPGKTPPGKTSTTTSAEYAPYVEFGTHKMGAQPFMTPAAEMNQPKFESAMKQLLQRLG